MPHPTKDSLIESLINDGYLKTPAIIAAFKAIDRADFVREEFKEHSYINQALPIGLEQTISQPLTVAFMLELLEPKPGEKILDIGAGSGWQTALLAEIIGQSRINADNKQMTADNHGRIVAIERIPEILEFAKTNLSKYQFQNINLVSGDGSKGFQEDAPYDKIIAAAAAKEIPLAWKEQLKIGGRIVTPINESIIILDKIDQNNFKEKQYFGFSFVPLVSGE